MSFAESKPCLNRVTPCNSVVKNTDHRIPITFSFVSFVKSFVPFVVKRLTRIIRKFEIKLTHILKLPKFEFINSDN
jgi:hypothetical protein